MFAKGYVRWSRGGGEAYLYSVVCGHSESPELEEPLDLASGGGPSRDGDYEIGRTRMFPATADV